jgi:hypothetical protein
VYTIAEKKLINAQSLPIIQFKIYIPSHLFILFRTISILYCFNLLHSWIYLNWQTSKFNQFVLSTFYQQLSIPDFVHIYILNVCCQRFYSWLVFIYQLFFFLFRQVCSKNINKIEQVWYQLSEVSTTFSDN